MAGLLAIIWCVCALLLPKAMGKAKQTKKLSTVFARSRSINVLSAARLFLFASRDVWFVVGVPVFLAAALSWDFWQIGASWGLGRSAMALFKYSPPDYSKALKGSHPRGRSGRILAILLLISTLAMPLVLYSGIDSVWVVLVGLSIYGVIFALNSSVHSYLVLQYASRDEVASDVGFYYASNAAGRLLGTLASGTLAWLGGSAGVGGLLACLWGPWSSLPSVCCAVFCCRMVKRMSPANRVSPPLKRTALLPQCSMAMPRVKGAIAMPMRAGIISRPWRKPKLLGPNNASGSVPLEMVKIPFPAP